METEIWKDIPWYEWKYQASTMGRIKSYPNKWNFGIWKVLKWWKDKFWYRNVWLFFEWKQKTILVHRVIWMTFLWLLEIKWRICVCHKDDNPSNNELKNLFLWTDKDNSEDMVSKWRHYFQWKFWKDHNRSKIVFQFSKEWEFIWKYFSTLEAQRITKIDSWNIRSCCLWYSKTAWGYRWSYNNNL